MRCFSFPSKLADDKHFVLLAKLNKTIRLRESKPVRSRMDGSPFQGVFRRNRINVLLDDLDFGIGGAGEVPWIQSRADAKVVREDIL